MGCSLGAVLEQQVVLGDLKEASGSSNTSRAWNMQSVELHL